MSIKTTEGQSEPKQEWHSVSIETLAELLKADIVNGLTSAEAKIRLAKSGPNTLPQAKQRTTLAILLAQFRSLVVLLLVVATVH